MKMASIIASGAAMGQITLGAVVIIERLHAVLVTVHLGLGLVLFAMMLLVVSYSYGLSSNKERSKKVFIARIVCQSIAVLGDLYRHNNNG